jgi:chitodextrinase
MQKQNIKILILFLVFTFGLLSLPGSSQAAGVLRVSPVNPRYFTDDSGKAIYLTGSHTWANMKDEARNDPPTPFNFNTYLNLLQSRGHNFIRLWNLELTKYQYDPSFFIYTNPQPWQRIGPGNALDGKLKFDLNKFDQSYFDRLRSRIIAARDRGIYVSIMFFEGHGVQKSLTPWASNGHPFNSNNNINGINGDSNNDGRVTEIHTMANSAITKIQEDYIKKAVDTVNDLDNVLYEVGNEIYPNSTEWQYHMVNYIKNYETAKPKQHLVGMTFQFEGGSNNTLWNSPADWISPNSDGGYRDNPPAGDGRKVVISDTDHLWGIGGDRIWVWKTFIRGLNPIYMDSFPEGGNAGNDPLPDEGARNAMGHTLTYAKKMNFINMTPSSSSSDCSTTYCLRNPGNEYLIYQPGSGSFTVNMIAGNYNYEWFNPNLGTVVSTGTITASNGNRTFSPPFSGEAVLYLSKNNSNDTTAPSVPASLTATAGASSQINLNWTASTDPVVAGQTTSGLAGYKIYRNGTEIATSTTTSYFNTGLTPSTTYSYMVAAYDGAGNTSAQSAAKSATTWASGSYSFCTDSDQDGYGAPGSTGCVQSLVDCNDANANINPGKAEVCANAIDENCSGAADEGCSANQSPYPGPNPHVIPGTVEVENFDLGGEGKAVHDTTTGNLGGTYRMSEPVDIEACSAGGYNVGYVAAGEWMQYTVNVATAGNYDVEVQVAAINTGGTFHIEFNGVDKTGALTVPNTGGWQTWTVVKKTNVALTSGAQTMKVVIDSAPGNFNSVKFTASTTNVTYLSDLPWVSAINAWGPVEKDRSNGESASGDGKTITLNGVTYPKGLGVHAASEIKYNLAGKYSRFISDVGVDDEMVNTAASSVVFQVYAGGVKIYDSGTMTPTTATQKIDVDISGKTELRLVVTDGGNGISSDHGDWANAQVVPASTAAYLSDLTWTSSTNGFGPVEKDKSNGENAAGDGKTITLNGVTYPKGLGVHAASEIKYNLAGKYSRFVSDIGVDDEMVNTAVSSVVFQVYADGVKIYDSGTMTPTTATQKIDVDISGKNELRLVVTDGGNGISSDHGDWANAQVVPAATATYLSDLAWVSTANGYGPVEKDKSNGENAAGDGKTITLNGVTYQKGLGVHAASEIKYNLAGKYSRFVSDIGVDDEMTANSSIVFQVYADGVKIYDSGTMTPTTATKKIDVDISGKNELRLVVTDGGNGTTADHGDWAGALVC